MGDFFQHIVDIDATVIDAKKLGSQIRDWLININVIENKLTDCILGENKRGYPPGKRYKYVVNYHPKEIDIRKLWTNGLDINIGREVYTSGQSGTQEIMCPKCGLSCEGNWGEAIGIWYDNKGEGDIQCTRCGKTQSITKWIFETAWGFSELGFTFWNWSPFKDKFIKDFENHLGHRILYIHGKF